MAIEKLSAELLRQHKGLSFVGITTCFFCYDGNGKFFLAQRSQGARDEQGTWEMGGGGLKWGAAMTDNIRREVKEEFNAEILALNFLGYRDIFRALSDGTPTHWVAIDYAVQVDPSKVKINEPDMFDDAGWFTLANLPSPLHSQQMGFFEKYAAALKEYI